MRAERSLLDVFNDIFGNLQDIVRSEIRLAKAEVTDQLRGARPTALGLVIALLASACTVLFLLFAAMYALRLVLTTWGAALAVAGATAVVSGVAFYMSARSMRAHKSIAQESAATIKENLEWAKQSTK